MERIYRCPKCYSISDTQKRCKKCGTWMVYDGKMSREEAIKKSEDIGKSIIPSYVTHNW